jgi:predicted GTPase
MGRSPRTIIFMGKTGAGKSSLINASFGLSLFTDNAQAATRGVTEAPVHLPASGLHRGRRATVIDTPGFAESLEREPEYIALYREVLPRVTDVVWTVQAHPRVYRPDEVMFAQIGDFIPRSATVLLALTHVDTLAGAAWDTERNSPSAQQRHAIDEVAAELVRILGEFWPLTRADVVPCASNRHFGLAALTGRLTR